MKKENNELVSATTQLKLLANDWTDYMNAMIKSPTDNSTLKTLLQNALTDDIHSRDMYMKGIDYSYYYEEN